MIFGLNLAFVAYLAWAFAHAISALDGRVMYSLATLVLGIPASGIVFLLLYGYGSLVENVEGIREDVHALRKAGEEKTIRSK